MNNRLPLCMDFLEDEMFKLAMDKNHSFAFIRACMQTYHFTNVLIQMLYLLKPAYANAITAVERKKIGRLADELRLVSGQKII